MLGHSWGAKEAQRKTFRLRFGLGVPSPDGGKLPTRKVLCWGFFPAILKAMLDQCWAIWGLSWDNVLAFVGICGVPPWFLELKYEPNKNFLLLRFILEALGELCRTHAGPMLGHMGLMLGPGWVICVFFYISCNQKTYLNNMIWILQEHRVP